MTSDEERLAALRKGAGSAPPAGNVAIRAADLKWLLDQVEQSRRGSLIPHNEEMHE